MFSFLINKIKELVDIFIKLDKEKGFVGFIKFLVFLLMVVVVIRIGSISKSTINFVVGITKDIHLDKMRERDKYMTDLAELLLEFRSKTDADRILYFEYHNSEENFEGLPFKFFDLMNSNPRYGVAPVKPNSYRNVQSGRYIQMFNKINKGDFVYCKGEFDESFRTKYPGVYSLFFETDHSKQFYIFSVPGIKRPVGFIVVEWLDDKKSHVITEEEIRDFIPRINAISVSGQLYNKKSSN